MNVTDKIFSYGDGNKNYIVFYCVSYDEDYYADEVSTLSRKCFKYEYTEIVAKSTAQAVENAKKMIPIRLKETAPFSFFKDKKNVKLDSIEEVYVQTIHDREFVTKGE